MKINFFENKSPAPPQKVPRNMQKTGFDFGKMPYLPMFAIEGKYFLSNLNFTGGDSLNLKATIENIKPEDFPPDIRELALEILTNGNPDNKTLIGVHKEKYGAMFEMETLDEIKAQYPEFSGVLSDSEIKYNKGGFIDDVKNDRLEYFNSDEDVAVQLLKMYWAQGISLNGFKEYTGGKNIEGVLRTLHIDRVKPLYGQYLRFSDKTFNDQVTTLMTKNRLEALKTKQEKEEGVYIPRGPLTEEHKRKISEGLIRHYTENPDKLAELSKRQKRYYEEHPEEQEKLTRVLNIAWNLREAKSIRKAMSKFMKRKLPDVIVLDKNGMIISGVDSSLLKLFWTRNVWAKKQWSICMKKAWELEKRETAQNDSAPVDKETAAMSEMYRGNGVFEFAYYPKTLVSDFKAWHLFSGGNPSDIKSTNTLLSTRGDKVPLPEVDKFSEQRLMQYFKENPAASKNFEKSVKYALTKLSLDLWEMGLETDSDNASSKEKKKADFMLEIANYIDNKVGANNLDIEVTGQELYDVTRKVVFESCEKGYSFIAHMLEENIEEFYKATKTSNPNEAMMKIFGGNEDEIKATKESSAALAYSSESNAAELKFDIYPYSMQKDFKNWGAKNGHNISKINSMEVNVTLDPMAIVESPEVQELIVDYLKNASEVRSNAIADTYFIAMAKTCGEIHNILRKNPQMSEKKSQVLTQIHNTISGIIGKEGRTVQRSTEELLKEFIILTIYCQRNDANNIARMLLDNAEIAYRAIKSDGTKSAYKKLLVKPGYISL